MRYQRSAILGLALLSVSALVACEEKNEVVIPPPAIEVEVSPTSVDLEVGQTRAISATVRNAQSDNTVTWSTDNGSVATVSQSGVITAVGAGSTLVHATSNEDNTKRASVSVSVTAPPPPVVAITMLPEEVDILVGNTVDLVVTVTGSANTNFTCEAPAGSSSVATVAQVAGGCRVTGVGPGTVVVTARAAADNTKVASSVVRVTAPAEPSVSIQELRSALGGFTVTPNNVNGTINVVLNVDMPPGSGVERLVLLIGDVEVYEQVFTSTGEADTEELQSAVEIVANVPTAAFNSATGQPRHLNGSTNLTAILERSGGLENKSDILPITLTNTDTFLAIVTTQPVTSGPTGSALDPNGLLWHEGDVSVELRPVMYSGNTIASSTITISNLPGSSTRAGLTATFPKSSAIGGGTNGVANANTTNLTLSVSSVLGNGQPGPNGIAFIQWNGAPELPPIIFTPAALTAVARRLDNQPPVTGTFQLTPQALNTRCCLENWIGREITFGSTTATSGTSGFYTAGGESDAGVGLPSSPNRTFHVGLAGESNTTIANRPAVTNGQEVNTIAGLPPTATNDVYAAVVRITDRLGNVALGRLQANAPSNPNANASGAVLGLDLVDPTITYAAGTPRHMFVELVEANAIDWFFDYVDSGLESSGFGPTPVRVSLFTNLGATPVSSLSAGSPFTIAGGAQAYYRVEAIVRDRAGNESAPASAAVGEPAGGRIVLRDEDAPTLTGPVVLPASLTTAEITVSANVADNVDLFRADARIQFDGGFPGDADATPSYPFDLPVALSTPFASPRVTAATASQTILNVVALELSSNGDGANGGGGLAGGTADAPSGTLFAAAAAGIRVRDAARWESEFGAVYTATPPTAAAVSGITSFAVTGPSVVTTLCNNAGNVGCGGEPTSTNLTITQIQPVPGFEDNVFTHIAVYYDEDDGVNPVVSRLIALIPASSANVTTSVTERTFTYTVPFDVSGDYLGRGVLQQANIPVYAIGLRSGPGSTKTGLRSLNNTTITVVGDLNP